MSDFRIFDQGSLVMVEPVTDAAKEWVDENVQLEGWQWLGPAFGVDHRMIVVLASAIAAEGFEMVEG